MFRVNQLLLTRIFFRALSAFTIIFITLYFTGRIGDAAGYLGFVKFNFEGGRTELVKNIFSVLTIFYSFFWTFPFYHAEKIKITISVFYYTKILILFYI